MSENIIGENQPEVQPEEQQLDRQFYDHVQVAADAKRAKEKAAEPVKEDKVEEPWKTRTDKEQTPKWARERFREYSAKVREKDERIEQLTRNVEDILKAFKPKVSEELNPSDFATQAEYAAAIAKKEAKNLVSTELEAHNARQEAQRESEHLEASHARNIQAALVDIPDYYEATANGDPDITLPVNVIRHLKVSPAGPYTEYRIATDDELGAALKAATSPQQKYAIISQVHDEILAALGKRTDASKVSTPAQTPQQSVQAQSPAVRKAIPPHAAPPKTRGMVSNVDITNMSTDDYIRARNEQKRNGVKR